MSERKSQKDRTREALLRGARLLIEDGQSVTVAKVAERVGVSRATAYRYFRDPAVLAAEAGLSIEVQDYHTVTAGTLTLRDRLEAINLYFFDLTVANEAGFRQFMARSMEATLAQTDQPIARRGARRIAMYKTALDDAGVPRGKSYDMLCHALATSTGLEAFIALVDVCGLPVEDAREAAREMALMAMDRFLED